MTARNLIVVLFTGLCCVCHAQKKEILIYHPIQTDKQGNILPWYNINPGKSYDHVIHMVWNFWDTMRRDVNGLPYYMNHQVWNSTYDDPRGIGGDQFAMALSSWRLLYAYTGDERVKANMDFVGDYYLSHGLSPADAKWPNIPFPYNTLVYSGVYDGDMRNGKDVAQPDKAGSFGLELIHLYKMSQGYNIKVNPSYLQAAINIANTLASHISQGDSNYSPLPFKINVFTGQNVLLRFHDLNGTWIDTAGYSTNWAPTMQLFLDLIALHTGDTTAYRKGFVSLLIWMKAYPMEQNKWGPFFEDVDWWSETQINAMTFARFIMEHRQYFPDWKSNVLKIITWVHTRFSNTNWRKYGVTVTNEQSVYLMPGESHTSRQAADELLWVSLTGDSTFYVNAVRALNWATYTVGFDGRNRFPGDEPWLTDGYGDYVRHYLRAMDAAPVLTPPAEDHILSSTSVIQEADYAGHLLKFYALNFEKVDSNKVRLFYEVFDSTGTEKIKLTRKPTHVLLDYKALPENQSGEGYSWQPMNDQGGLLTIRRKKGNQVLLLK
jgi:hypothetical protein